MMDKFGFIDLTLDEYYTNHYTIEKITPLDLQQIINSIKNKTSNIILLEIDNLKSNDDKIDLIIKLISKKISDNILKYKLDISLIELNNNDINDLEQLFINYKDIINIQSTEKETLLHHVVFIGNYNICELLLTHGSNPCIKDQSGQPVLHRTVFSADTRIIPLLLKYGANINEQDNDGNTALHLATLIKNKNIIKTLLQNGADKNIKNLLQIKPIEFALIKSNGELIIDPEIEDIF